MVDPDEVKELLPSGETVPLGEADHYGPDAEYNISEVNTDELFTYAIRFGHQSVYQTDSRSGSSLGKWIDRLDLETLFENPSVILTVIDDLNVRNVEMDDDPGEDSPTLVKRVANTFLHVILSRLIIKARIEGKIHDLPKDVLVALAQYHEPHSHVAPRIYGTVFLASDHPEFPTDTAISHPALYTELPLSEHPHQYSLLALLWYVDADLFNDVFERIVSATDEEFIQMGYESPDRARMVDEGLDISSQYDVKHCIESLFVHVISIDGSIPYVFCGDPSAELTQRVEETLPERSEDEYMAFLETVRDQTTEPWSSVAIQEAVTEFTQD